MSELILVFDTETTGLTLHPDAPLHKQPKIIEIGIALLDRNGAIVETINHLIDPQEQVTEEITKITGITNDDLKGAFTFPQALPSIRGAFDRAAAVFAHNLPFDKTMLKNELARAAAYDFPWPKNEYCTVGIHKEQWGRNPKLTELYEFATGVPLPQTHRALDDVLALVDAMLALDLHTMAFSELELQ